MDSKNEASAPPESNECSSHDSLQAQSRSDTAVERVPSEQFAIAEPQDQDDDRCAGSSLRRRRRSTRPHWIEKVTKLKLSLVLENSGSVARDHLAAERTFLAYVRTSLGLATMGVTLVQLLALTPSQIPSALERMGKFIGAVTVLLGIMVMLIAVFRYFSMQSSLIEGKYKPAGMIVHFISTAIGLMILLITGLIFGIAFS